MVESAGVAVRVFAIDGGAAFVLGQQLLDFPIVHFRADRELQVFLGNRIPVLRRKDGSATLRT